jgi:dUTP pyrophosphatase
MNSIKIKIKKLSPEAILPKYAHEGDAGMDVFSIENLIIRAGEKAMIHTGISIELPMGFVALVWDKSGLAAKNGLKTMGGVIEHSYRGEYCIIILNTSKEDFEIEKGQKIAQILIQPIFTAKIQEVEELSNSIRGENGFGSTGL